MNTVATETKQLILEYFYALSGHRKTERLIDRYVSDPGLKQHISTAEAAFPEYELIPDLIVSESDLVAARCTFRGVHKGQFAGIEPTGKAVSVNLMIFYRISDGKIVEHWMQMDSHGLLDQLAK